MRLNRIGTPIDLVSFAAVIREESCEGDYNRPLSLGGHVESQENKKLYFCTASLALNSRLAEACPRKTKLFIRPRIKMAADKDIS